MIELGFEASRMIPKCTPPPTGPSHHPTEHSTLYFLHAFPEIAPYFQMKSPNQTHGPHSLSFLEWTTTIAPSPTHMSCPSWKKPPAPPTHIPILPGINRQHSLWGYIPYPSWREPPNSIPVHILCFLARRGPTGSHWVFFTVTILVFFGVDCSAVRCEMATSPSPIHPPCHHTEEPLQFSLTFKLVNI